MRDTAGRSRDVLISHVTPVGPFTMDMQRQDDQLEHTYSSTGCSSEDVPEAVDDREGWRERIKDICADSVT